MRKSAARAGINVGRFGQNILMMTTAIAGAIASVVTTGSRERPTSMAR